MKLGLILALKNFSVKVLKILIGWCLILKISSVNSPYMYKIIIRNQQMFLVLWMY